jgi:hypothetical protein
MREGYDVMQVCANGHRINSSAQTMPEFSSPFCSNCGAPTATTCQHCNTPIRGYYHSEGIISLAEPPVPKYCHNCGKPYPWQAAAIESLKEALREGSLTDSDLSDAESAIPDIVHDTPRTGLASLKLKRVLSKIAKPVSDIAIKIVTEIATAEARKHLGL